MRNFNKNILVLILIIILAAILRIYRLDSAPVALYSDELASGYNAYSIGKTGKDEFGVMLPIALRSFGDWKTALPAYLAIPTTAIFGLNGWGVRLPAAIVGILTIICVYFLTKLILLDCPFSGKPALLSAFFFAISPWHILHSRALLFEGFGLFFLIIGVLSFYKAFKNPSFLYFSVLSFGLSLYSYHSLRIVTPLIIIFLLVKSRNYLFENKKTLFRSILTGLIILAPIVLQLFSNPEILFGRARYISIFYDQGPQLRIWELQTQDGSSQNTLITNFFHNKPYSYSINILSRYLSHLDANFLYFTGDKASPFQISNMGFMYFADFILLMTGLYMIKRYYQRQRSILFFWICISIIPAAFTFVTPSSNRILNLLYPFIVVQVIGLLSIISSFKSYRIQISLLITIIYFLSFLFFLKQFFMIMPSKYSSWWHYGFKELVLLVESKKNQYDRIIFSNKLGVPYIFFLFYKKYDPILFHKEAKVDFHKDNLGFIHVNSYSKYEFMRFFDWKSEKDNMWPNSLYVISSEEENNLLPKYSILDPEGKVIFRLYSSSGK